ncbi:MAG: GNAT family N-acetyltransferase [Chloroflexota bacterium]
MAETWRGRGIGQALFATAVSWAKARGLVSIQTSVWSVNSDTRTFYLKQGFAALT